MWLRTFVWTFIWSSINPPLCPRRNVPTLNVSDSFSGSSAQPDPAPAVVNCEIVAGEIKTVVGARSLFPLPAAWLAPVCPRRSSAYWWRLPPCELHWLHINVGGGWGWGVKTAPGCCFVSHGGNVSPSQEPAEVMRAADNATWNWFSWACAICNL